MDTPDSWTKDGSPPKSKLHAAYGTSAKNRPNRLYYPDYRLLRDLPRAPIVRSIEQRVFPLPFLKPRTKAAQRRCTIMHVMCVKPVTSCKRGMKIAAKPRSRRRSIEARRPARCRVPPKRPASSMTATHHPGSTDENLPLQSLLAPRLLRKRSL
ncbi:MAG TPA: hypothetical protein VEN30_16180 [Paraburkholderia sp.]|nr:hypothetical protein [Paraburkholderia sp.]